MSNQPQDKPKRSRWPLTTLIEILPVIIALTVFLSYTTIKGVSSVALVTPLTTVLNAVPLWVVILMALILLVGASGMGWLIYIFTRAPVAADGSEAESQQQ
ncbi:MAG: hypothetical protein DYG89_50540 [Caldilinea sp. CFX5]|nr:hypothetical protein [Caldilinea sp. CFX5]